MPSIDLNADCEALKAYFIHRRLAPHEGMILMCLFMAEMIWENSKDNEDIDRKIALQSRTIREFLEEIRQEVSSGTNQ